MDARLVTLERQVLTLKRLLFISLIGVAGAFAAGAAGAAQKSLTFADAAGHTRVKIDATGVQMYGPNSKRAVLLGFNKYGKPALYLQDSRGVERFAAYISTKQENATLDLSDKQDVDRVYLSVENSGPALEFDDVNTKPRLLVGLSNDGSGIVHTISAAGKVGTALEDDKVTVSNADGDERVYLGTSTDGNGILKIFDSSIRERAYMGVFTDGNSGFEALDSSGNATWTSP